GSAELSNGRAARNGNRASPGHSARPSPKPPKMAGATHLLERLGGRCGTETGITRQSSASVKLRMNFAVPGTWGRFQRSQKFKTTPPQYYPIIPMPSGRRHKSRRRGQVLLTSHAVMFRCASVIISLFVCQIVRTSRILDHDNTARGSV